MVIRLGNVSHNLLMLLLVDLKQNLYKKTKSLHRFTPHCDAFAVLWLLEAFAIYYVGDGNIQRKRKLLEESHGLI